MTGATQLVSPELSRRPIVPPPPIGTFLTTSAQRFVFIDSNVLGGFVRFPTVPFLTQEHVAMETQRGTQEARWAKANPAALLPYRGRWVAILDGAVVADGATASEVLKSVRDRGLAYALIRKVPTRQRPRLIA